MSFRNKMVSFILVITLVTIILIILLSFISRMTKKPERLKTRSIVIIDTRGQQSVSETEFVKFMDKVGTFLVNTRHFDQNLDVIDPETFAKKSTKSAMRGKFQDKYIDPAANELKAWIKSTDNHPFVTEASFTNPLDDELNSLCGENNPILIHKRLKNNDLRESADRLATLEDLASYIKQIKEINLQFPDNERKAVNMIATHKLLLEILSQYYKSLDPSIFQRNITEVVDMPAGAKQAIGEAKMKEHRSESGPVLDASLSQRNSIVDTSSFADDDKSGTSNSRSHDNIDYDKTNSAIEGMVVRRAPGRVKYTGGRKFIIN